MSKEVATREPQGLETPSFLAQFTGAGNENVQRNDMTVPRLGIIQDLSPQRKKGETNYIPGAEAGMLFHTISNDLYPDGCYVVNAFFDKAYAVFRDRKKGGGFRGVFQNEAEALHMIANHPEGSELETREQAVHYVLILDADKNYVTEAAIVCESTKLKFSRKWNSMIQIGNPHNVRFQKIWRLTTKMERNTRNETYYNYEAAPAGFVTETLAKLAFGLKEAVAGGAKRVASDDSEAITVISSNEDLDF